MITFKAVAGAEIKEGSAVYFDKDGKVYPALTPLRTIIDQLLDAGVRLEWVDGEVRKVEHDKTP